MFRFCVFTYGTIYQHLFSFDYQRTINILLVTINPFHATGIFLYPLKKSENLWFSDVFRGYRKRPVA